MPFYGRPQNPVNNNQLFRNEPGFPRWIVVHGFEGFSGLIFWHRVHSSSGFGWVWTLRLGFFRWIWSGSDRFDAATKIEHGRLLYVDLG